MRAIFLNFEKENLNQTVIVTDESAKHLQVVRVKENDEILLLNGRGLKAFSKVRSISKKSVEFLIESIEEATPTHEISLAIAAPKKDAFEDILKMAVELGVRDIYPLTSDFSQYEYSPSDRVMRILESALVQSNNSYMPTIHPQTSLEIFLSSLQSPLYFFNSKSHCSKNNSASSNKKTVLIGPEGGFSEKEEVLILAKNGVSSIHLSTPILRAPTAVASSIGYLLCLELI